MCASDGECRTSLTCIGGTCEELPSLGETCETRCAEGWCDQGTCAARQPAGEPCDSNPQCESYRCDTDTGTCQAIPVPGEDCLGFVCQDQGRCWEGVCQAPQPVGSDCVASAQCAPGLRCVDTTCVEILLPGELCQEAGRCARGTRCIDGRCRPLPDVGEACAEETGCLRGDCNPDTGVCENRSIGATCGPDADYPYDLFDPCGDASTCIDVDGTTECVADLSQGDACGAMVAAQCPSDTSCEPDPTDTFVCQAICTGDAL
jgi:hypothetical protein